MTAHFDRVVVSANESWLYLDFWLFVAYVVIGAGILYAAFSFQPGELRPLFDWIDGTGTP